MAPATDLVGRLRVEPTVAASGRFVAWKVVASDYRTRFVGTHPGCAPTYPGRILSYQLGETVANRDGIFVSVSLEAAVKRWRKPAVRDSGARVLALEFDEADVIGWAFAAHTTMLLSCATVVDEVAAGELATIRAAHGW